MMPRKPDRPSAEKAVRDIRRATRRRYSAEEKIRIVLEGLRGEEIIAEPCRREGLNANVYYRCSKEFLEAGKKRLSGDTQWEATSGEVKDLRGEAAALKEALAELLMENRLLKKSVTGDGEDDTRDIRPQKSTRLSSWLSDLTCLSGKHWHIWIFTGPLSTTGCSVIVTRALMSSTTGGVGFATAHERTVQGFPGQPG